MMDRSGRPFSNFEESFNDVMETVYYFDLKLQKWFSMQTFPCQMRTNAELDYRAGFPEKRLAFGSCFDEQKKYLYLAGGMQTRKVNESSK